MQSIVSKGKDVKEAIDLGLQLMETNKNEVSIEIIQYETKGFMGIGGKKAIVKITKGSAASSKDHQNKETVTSELYDNLDKEISSITIEDDVAQMNGTAVKESGKRVSDQDLEGKVWVQNGVIHVKDSESQYPVVKIGQGIQLYKDSKLVLEKTLIVSEKDKLEVKLKQDKQDTKWLIKLDEHNLLAKLEIIPGFVITRRLPDSEPQHQIELVAEEKKQIENTLTYDEVLKKLEEKHVTYGINDTEILRAIEAKEAGTFIIARGIEAQPGKNGWVELNVDIDTKNGLIENEAGTVDFRELKMIPTVDHGKIIATIHPPIPGKSGTTVTREVLPAKKVHPVQVKAGNGVIKVDDKIVATESGRPFVEQRGQLCKASIMPKLVHNGNLDIASGNIRFHGDVEIRGEVEERMVVEARGDIVVFKSVNDATITTSKSIVTHGNVTGSELSAGKNNMLVAELGHLLGIINIQVEKMITVIRQLTDAPAFKSTDFSRGGLQPLINILLEKKFNGLRSLIKKYVDVTNRGKEHLEDENWTLVSVSLKQIFLTLSNQVTSLERIISLSEKMKELNEFSKTPIEPDSYITISNTLNSSLYCSGNIIIIGQGAVNTKIHAGGYLKVSGVVRGGEVYGRLGVNINESGSDRGTKTVIVVPSDQRIKIKKAMEGTSIKIGHASYYLHDTVYDVNAHLNEQGQLVLY